MVDSQLKVKIYTFLISIHWVLSMYDKYIESTQTSKLIIADHTKTWSEFRIEPETSSRALAYATTAPS